MRETTCSECGSRFHVATESVATVTECPTCTHRRGPVPGERVAPPWLGGGEAAAEPADVDAEAATTTLPPPEVDGGDGGWEPPGGHDGGGGSDRNFSPAAEDDQRRRNLFRIGLWMTVAFFAPIVGVPGQFLVFPELSGEVGVFAGQQPALVIAVRLLPLLAGIAVMVASRMAEPPLRGLVVTGAGCALFGLFVADVGARRALGELISGAPTSVSLPLLLLVVGTTGMFVGARTRWYLPTNGPSYVIGLVGAVSYVGFHVVPSNGAWPIGDMFRTFQFSFMAGLATAVNFGCILTAAVVCALNVPSTPSFFAVTRARLCFRLLITSLALPLVLVVLSVLSISTTDSAGLLFAALSAGAKYGVMYGGLLLLIPVGITDLLVGRTPDA